MIIFLIILHLIAMFGSIVVWKLLDDNGITYMDEEIYIGFSIFVPIIMLVIGCACWVADLIS